MDLIEIAKAVSIPAGLLLTMYGIYDKMIKPVVKYTRSNEEWKNSSSQRMDKIDQNIEHLLAEVKVNGGNTTLRDKLTNIGKDVKVIMGNATASFYLSENPMFKNDKQGNCTAANSALCKIFGATEVDMLGYGWVNFIVKEERDRAYGFWMEQIERAPVISDSYTIKNGDTGALIKVKYKAVVSHDTDGSPLSVIGTCSIEK